MLLSERIRDLLSNRVYKKVAVVSSTLFVAVAVIATIWGLRYAEQRYEEDLKERVSELAVVGANQSRELLLDAVDKGHVTVSELFSETYRKIGLEEFRSSYVRTGDQARITDDYLRLLMDRVVEEDVDEYYRYHTVYDQIPLLMDGALQIEEPFLEVANIDFALMVDRQGYAPFHHVANSRPLTGDLETDIIGNRTKRIWLATGRSQRPEEVAYVTHLRESGEPYLTVLVPIRLNDRHWGAFVIGYRATEIGLAVSTMRRQATLAILSTVILVVIIYSFSINLALRPLAALHRGVRRLDAGHLDETLAEGSRDEIGYLGRSLNEMVSSIRDYSEKLETSNLQLIQARDEAEAANKSKSVFLANISHEFRTPLNAISGFSDILRRSITDPGHKTQLAEIEASSRSLTQLVDRILNYSKSESEQIKIVAVPVEVIALFGDLEERFLGRANARGLEFTIDLDPGLPTVVAIDSERLQQILDSLIDNAIKFTAQGHVSVLVRAAQSEDTLDLSIDVQDTGVGIAEDQHADIFEPLTQARDQSINEYGGTGMGLALAQRIIEAMAGTITVTSQVGVGSTFRISLNGVRVVDRQTIGEAADAHAGETADEEPSSSDATAKDDLSPDDRARLAEVLSQEKQSCSELAKTLSINEVEVFAARIQEIGQRFEHPPVVAWGEALLGQVDGFDIEGMTETLQAFDSLVEKVRPQAS
jgi:signal transduction histidine kinase